MIRVLFLLEPLRYRASQTPSLENRLLLATSPRFLQRREKPHLRRARSMLESLALDTVASQPS